ncbi:unnamed protein product [Albugo candida]|uniref:Uncharacterized protein n=1 Tax=Albugo candida TaxID=65357 RepID=A0A024GSD1_9STRA|nr:unnamed protein product [Albugo candida]|eukprot:CCI49828.1 unnamed protein product [Albugo candida]
MTLGRAITARFTGLTKKKDSTNLAKEKSLSPQCSLNEIAEKKKRFSRPLLSKRSKTVLKACDTTSSDDTSSSMEPDCTFDAKTCSDSKRKKTQRFRPALSKVNLESRKVKVGDTIQVLWRRVSSSKSPSTSPDSDDDSEEESYVKEEDFSLYDENVDELLELLQIPSCLSVSRTPLIALVPTACDSCI